MEIVLGIWNDAHNGPVSSEEELDDLLLKFKDDPANKRKALIIYEIRNWKFSVLNVKDSNPLFLQKHLHSCQLSRIQRETHAFHSNLTQVSAKGFSPAFLPHSLVPPKSEISIQKFEKAGFRSFLGPLNFMSNAYKSRVDSVTMVLRDVSYHYVSMSVKSPFLFVCTEVE